MRTKLIGLFSLVSALGAGQAQAPGTATQGELTAAKFGALEGISQISLAPDGNNLAHIGNVGESQVIFIADLVGGGQPKPIIRLTAADGNLSWCRWASQSRLVCQIRSINATSGILIGFTRMFALDIDGRNAVKLTKETNSNSHGILQDGGHVIDWDVADKPGQVLMTRVYVPDDQIGSHLGSQDTGMGIDLVDTVTLKRSRYESPNKDAVDYLTDGYGNVRIMETQDSTSSGYVASKLKYHYRRAGSKDWQFLSTVSLSGQGSGGFSPVAVDPKADVVFGFDDEKDKVALFSIALDGSNKREVKLARNDVDIDELVTIGRNKRVVGASYATERRAIDYFDPELKTLSVALGKALPGKPNVDIRRQPKRK